MSDLKAGVIAVAVLAALAYGGARQVAAQDAPIIVTFDRYSTARETRVTMEENGGRTTEIRFHDGLWQITVHGIGGGPATTHEPSEGCTTRATGTDTGVTGCHLFSVAQAERNLMETDGWVIEVRGRFNGETALWEFRWRRGT